MVNGGASESEQSAFPVNRKFDKLHFDASLLLSEPHAACQALQMSMREIQERLAAMVLQHSRAQRGQLDSGEEGAEAPASISTARESSDSRESAGAEQR